MRIHEIRERLRGAMVNPSETSREFQTNSSLRRIVEELPKIKFNPGIAIERAANQILARKSEREEKNPIAMLAEAHVAYALEELAKGNPDIDLNPIKTPSRVRHFRFRRERDTGNVTAINLKGPGGTVATETEYDNFFMARDNSGDVYVIVEVRSSKRGGSKGASRKNSSTLNSLLRPDVLAAKLAPLKIRFPMARHYGFVVFGSKEAIGESGEREKAFAAKGMYLLPLPISREEFEIHADALKTKVEQKIAAEVEGRLQFELATNPLLDKLTAFLEKRPDNIDEIFQQIISKESTHRSQFISEEHSKGYLLELYFRHMLRSFKSAVGRNTRRIKHPDFSRGIVSGEYLFTQRRSEVKVFKQVEGTFFPVPVAGYDELFLIDGLPVVAEVKSGFRVYGKDRIVHAMSPELINRKLKPLQGYFQRKKFGYIVAGLPENTTISAGEEERNRFREAGGILVTLPIPAAELEIYAKRMFEHHSETRQGMREQAIFHQQQRLTNSVH